MNNRLSYDFFTQEGTDVAKQLLGKYLVRKFENGEIHRYIITETEAYMGEEDLACHASKGRTLRTEVMYHTGGKIYVYLIYGIYWLLNFVTGHPEKPQAVLIRSVQDCSGPGRLGKLLQLDKTFYAEDACISERIWIEASSISNPIMYETPRIGIDYAGEVWKNIPWRFFIKL